MPKFKQILSESRHESLARLYWLFKATFFSPVDEFSIAASKSFLRLRFSAFKWSFSSKEWTKTKHTSHSEFTCSWVRQRCLFIRTYETSSNLSVLSLLWGLLFLGNQGKGTSANREDCHDIRALNLATLDGYSARFQSRGDDVDRFWNVTDQCSLISLNSTREALFAAHSTPVFTKIKTLLLVCNRTSWLK